MSRQVEESPMSLEQQKEQDLSQSIPAPIPVEEWKLLFTSEEEATKMKSIANQLIKSGLGKRQKESDLEYMMRIQYCAVMDIPYCLINKTYILKGVVSQMVEIKMMKLRKAYPRAEINVVMSSDTKCIMKGRIGPQENWIKREFTIEKANTLKLYHKDKAQWTENPANMLVTRCKGQLCDALGGLETMGSGFLSTEEVNSVGIDIK